VLDLGRALDRRMISRSSALSRHAVGDIAQDPVEARGASVTGTLDDVQSSAMAVPSLALPVRYARSE